MWWQEIDANSAIELGTSDRIQFARMICAEGDRSSHVRGELNVGLCNLAGFVYLPFDALPLTHVHFCCGTGCTPSKDKVHGVLARVCMYDVLTQTCVNAIVGVFLGWVGLGEVSWSRKGWHGYTMHMHMAPIIALLRSSSHLRREVSPLF